jgi:large subunit ribosomal protein L9
MIEVILLERIDRLGHMGQVVKVRPGFARNFLLPQKKALRATKSNLDQFEKQRAQLEAHNASQRSAAQESAGKMDNLSFVIVRQAGDSGQLYGSVSARDVADAAKEAGHAIERSMVYIDTPIKMLGLYPVKVKLHPEVAIKVTVNVARSAEEAVVQAQKGAAVIKAEEKAAADAAAVFTETAAPAGETEDAPKPAKKAKAKKADAADAETDEPKAKKPRAKKASAE